MINVTRAVLTASVFAALTAIASTDAARADANAPVCALGYGKMDGLSCNYANYDQCRAAISGTAGTCTDNPYYKAAQNQSPKPRDRRR